MNHPHLHISTPEALAGAMADGFATAASVAIARGGRFVVAIAGGSVADVLLPRLARLPLDWDRVHLMWCDERAVALTDRASNAGQAARLLEGTPAARAVRHPMPADALDLGAAADAYAAELALTLEDSRIDLVLLGVGEDGHIASLFPGHAALDETVKTVLPILDSPKPPSRRMTLTLPVLANARWVVVAAFGESKAAAIRDAVTGAGQSPVARLVRAAERVTMLLDDGAASRLDRPPA